MPVPVLVDLNRGTIAAVAAETVLGRSLLSTNEVAGFVPGPLARVATGGDCLNVRAAPTADAEVLRCYVDGVLLFERDANAPDGWVAVTTPDGREGWAAAGFLER